MWIGHDYNLLLSQVCVKIENPGGDAPKMFGRHFDETDMLISRVITSEHKSDYNLLIESN